MSGLDPNRSDLGVAPLKSGLDPIRTDPTLGGTTEVVPWYESALDRNSATIRGLIPTGLNQPGLIQSGTTQSDHFWHE